MPRKSNKHRSRTSVKAIIFDLDDTLYPEEEFVMSGFRTVAKHLAKKYGLNSSKIFNTLKSDFDQGARGKNFDLLLEKLNLPKRELKQLITIYRNHKPKVKLFSDAKKILKYLKENREVKIGLISDGPVKTQKNKLKMLKIEKIFNKIVLNDSLGKKYRKPHQRSFKLILKKLKVKPKETIYVGDNPEKDFIGAKKMGIFTIRIKRGEGIYENIKETDKNKADLNIFKFLELKNLCQKR